MKNNPFFNNHFMNNNSSKTRKRYDKRLREFGISPKTLGWLKGKQGIRFSVLTEIGKIHGSKIFDVGCGFGDLYGFLSRKKYHFSYLGLELNQNLIKIAKKKYPKIKVKNFDIESDKILGKCDWAILSGVFNFKRKENYRFIEKNLKKIFQSCRKGVAVDFVNSYVEYKVKDSFYASPAKIFEIGKRITPRVILRNDYMPFEFCIYLYKNNKITSNKVFIEFNRSVRPEFRSNKWLKK